MPKAEDRVIMWPELKADCERCTGLCCVAYPFIDPGKFGYEKSADQACRHLAPDGRCSIHAQREELGFKGCVVFDCNGAGQRVTNEIFSDIDWRGGGVSATEIFQAFRALTHIHAALVQLRLLEDLPFSAEQAERFGILMDWLAPQSGWTAETLEMFPAHRAEKQVQEFVASIAATEAGRALTLKLSGTEL